MNWECAINIPACLGCGICADVCAYGALEMTRDMPYPEPIPHRCRGCGECVTECPFDAIRVSETRPATSSARPDSDRDGRPSVAL